MGGIKVIDLTNANLSNVTSMVELEPITNSGIDEIRFSGVTMHNVKDMYGAFMNFTKITELDLSGIYTTKVTDMSQMFYNCKSLEQLDIRNFSIGYADCLYMFEGCDSLHTLRLDNCDRYTISEIINSDGFPTGTIEGVSRKIYCKESRVVNMTLPDGWTFEYVE